MITESTSLKDTCKEAFEKIEGDLKSLQDANILPKKLKDKGSFRFVNYDTKIIAPSTFMSIIIMPCAQKCVLVHLRALLL